MKLYFCVGCRQVHYDEDFLEQDGDLLIRDWDKFLISVEATKRILDKKNTTARGEEKIK